MLLGDHDRARKAVKLAEEKLQNREKLFVLRGKMEPNQTYAEIELAGSGFPEGWVEVELVGLKFCTDAVGNRRKGHQHFRESRRTAKSKYPVALPRQRFREIQFPTPIPLVRRPRPIVFEIEENLVYPRLEVPEEDVEGPGAAAAAEEEEEEDEEECVCVRVCV